MWRGYLHPWYAEAAGCLIVRNCIEGEYVFDYPITGPEGDEEAALAAIEAYCGEKELPLVLSVVPEDKAAGRRNTRRRRGRCSAGRSASRSTYTNTSALIVRGGVLLYTVFSK